MITLFIRNVPFKVFATQPRLHAKIQKNELPIIGSSAFLGTFRWVQITWQNSGYFWYSNLNGLKIALHLNTNTIATLFMPYFLIHYSIKKLPVRNKNLHLEIALQVGRCGMHRKQKFAASIKFVLFINPCFKNNSTTTSHKKFLYGRLTGSFMRLNNLQP